MPPPFRHRRRPAATAADLPLLPTPSITCSVGGLLNTLERDVYQAADRCWRLADRSVQLRGGLLRGKSVVVQVRWWLRSVGLLSSCVQRL